MKYISLLVVVLFIAFTFWFSRKTEDLTLDQMNKMNSMITQYMTQAVQTNQPNATEIDFSKISTEILEEGKKMRAHFSFSYVEPNAAGELEKVHRKGTFIITSEDGRKWTAQIEEAGDVQVEFMKPFEITPDAAGSAPAPTEEAPSFPVNDNPDAKAGSETPAQENPEKAK